MARPLTKRTKGGVLYSLPPAVETDIDRALLDDLATLRRRLLITERASPDYLQSETLVHLIRESIRTADDRRRDVVLPVLLGRCEAILKVKVSDGLPNPEALREAVLSDFSEVLASDGVGEQPAELDYYECRFNHAFRTLRLDVLNRELAAVNAVADLPEQRDEGESDAYDDVLARVTEAFHTPATQESTLFLKDLWKAIKALPRAERKAVILVFVLGYEEESDDPEKVTAATRCKCTGRTIRNRLSRAAAKLSVLKEDA